jgi:hypothetical protein|eukprot:COSAG03_NODE_683_length_6318_cov_4.005467_7_plen_152_part_00
MHGSLGAVSRDGNRGTGRQGGIEGDGDRQRARTTRREMLVRSTSKAIARTTSAKARPVQRLQLKRLIPVACLGLVGAALMWLACWTKPRAGQQWVEGSCEIYSGTVSREPEDKFLVRLDARFFHPSFPSPAEVWANGTQQGFPRAPASCTV